MMIRKLTVCLILAPFIPILGALQGCTPKPFFERIEANALQEGADPIYECRAGRMDFVQPDASEMVEEVDLLFVTDTSGSMDVERSRVAAGIGNYILALPEAVRPRVRIGVMLAHGASIYSGKLYNKNSEPLVLNIPDGAGSQPTLAELQAQLTTKFTAPPNEGATDGGEVGLYSLHKSFDNLSEFQAAGFYRPEAALVTIFVADENDICAEYPAGVSRVPDPNNIEIPAMNQFCGGVAPVSVLDRVRQVKGEKPILMGGVLYDGTTTPPAGGENELGYGYLELITNSNGLTVDMGGSESAIANGLSAIGELTTTKLSLNTEFLVSQNDVDPGSVSVRVDGVEVPSEYVEAVREVHIMDAGHAGSQVEINYCYRARVN